MLKKILNERSKFDYYFREADGDTDDKVSVKVVPKDNSGTDYNDDTTNVTVRPRSNRGTDYNDDGEDSDNTTNASAGEPSTSDTNDNNDDNDTGNEPDTGDGDDYNDDDTGDNENDGDGDNGGDTGNEPDTGDGTDYTDDESQGDNDDDNTEDGTASDEQNGNQSDDTSKKYSLYIRYLRLYDMIDGFSEKIRAVVKDDPSQNAVINKVVDNLNDLHDGMYEYMTIKFMTATYVEAVIYFETVINCVRLNFELLRNNKINLKQ